ncbi:MAG: hypothetical protein KAH77_11290 [Thiomargarita sp.]|nr:hypothetical protein [Thiomargarita sp.]
MTKHISLIFMVMMIALLQLSCGSHSVPPVSTQEASVPERVQERSIFVIQTPTTSFISPNTSSMRDTRKNTKIPKTVKIDHRKYYYMPNYGYVNFNAKIPRSNIKNTDIIIHDTPYGQVASPVKKMSDQKFWMYRPSNTQKSVLWHKKQAGTYTQFGVITLSEKNLLSFSKAMQVDITPQEYTFLQDLHVKFKRYYMLRTYLPAIAKTAEILSQEHIGNLLAQLNIKNKDGSVNDVIRISSAAQYNALKSLKGYTSLEQESTIFKAPAIMLVDGWFFDTIDKIPFYLKNRNKKWYWSVYTEQKHWKKTEIKIPETEISWTNTKITFPTAIKGKKKITTHSQEKPGKKILLSKCNDQYTCSFINIPTEKTYTILWVDEIPHSLVDTTSDPIELRPFQRILKLKVSRNLKIALEVLHKSTNYKALKEMAVLKELTAYPVSSNGKYFMPNKKGTFCNVAVTGHQANYQPCQQKFTPTPNTRKTVSWEGYRNGMGVWKEPVGYTQTVIHSNQKEAEYIFQTKQDFIFEDSETRGKNFDISKFTRRDAKIRGYWLVVDAYSDTYKVHPYSSLFADKTATQWLKNSKLKHTQLTMLQADALGPRDTKKRVNRQFVDKAIPEKALLLLSPSDNNKLIWEMHIHLAEKSSLGTLKAGIHQKIADKLRALHVDRLVVLGYSNSEYASDHQYKDFFENVVKKSNHNIQFKYIKVCRDNRDKITIPYTYIKSCQMVQE